MTQLLQGTQSNSSGLTLPVSLLLAGAQLVTIVLCPRETNVAASKMKKEAGFDQFFGKACWQTTLWGGIRDTCALFQCCHPKVSDCSALPHSDHVLT